MENCKVSEIEVSYKSAIGHHERIKINTSQSVVDLLRSIWADDLEIVESSYLLLLNHPGQVIGWKRLSIGGVRETVMDPRIIFGIACKSLATKIIIAHNHPSGMTQPGEADKLVTQKLKECGRFMDIILLDHIILTSGSYFSFADAGLL